MGGVWYWHSTSNASYNRCMQLSACHFGNSGRSGAVQTCRGTVSADDHRLIADCLHGNTAAFGDLVRRYQDRLFNTFYRLVDNAEEAQGVWQGPVLNTLQALV